MEERRRKVREYFEDTDNENGKENQDFLIQKRTKEFAEFLDNLYSEYHNYYDRLDMSDTVKLAEVIVLHPTKVIEELQKY